MSTAQGPTDLCVCGPGDVAGGCKLLRNRFESKDREWASYTCVLGFHVMGQQGALWRAVSAPPVDFVSLPGLQRRLP